MRAFSQIRYALASFALAAWLPALALEPASLQPPGHFVNLDTHRLYYECLGEGRPVVLVDYGIGGSAIAWRTLQQQIARHTRICVYDRAGYGWSDPGPAPRTTARAVEELRELVARLQLPPPFVLVGHSFGGFDTRYFAAKYPDEVAGLVWLDASHPDAPLGNRPAPGAARRNPLMPIAPAAAGTPSATDVGTYLATRRKAIFTQMDELANFATSAAEVKAAGPLPPVPLLVIRRDRRPDAESPRDEARWGRYQDELAALSPRGRLWWAKGSGHDIQHDRPDLVVEAVNAIVDEVRRREPLHAAAARP